MTKGCIWVKLNILWIYLVECKCWEQNRMLLIVPQVRSLQNLTVIHWQIFLYTGTLLGHLNIVHSQGLTYISYSVNQLCQVLHCPTTVHLTIAKRVLWYLKGISNHDLHFTPGSFHLQAFSDSDWAGDPIDQRSTNDYGVFLGNYLISWQSKKKPVVSRSSTEAEYHSVAIATAELYWLRMLFKELHISLRVCYPRVMVW